jgi:hypothetical protein
MRTVSLSGKNQKRHLSRPSSKSFGAMRSLQKNQRIFLGLVCAVFMWISGMYTGLYWTHINVKPTTSAGSFMENASISVPIFQKTSSCPSYVSVVWDVGRFGNQIFNYLVARLTAQVLGHEIFIMEDFADVFNQYFIGRKTQIVDWSYLKYECGIPESECAVREVNYLPELQPTSNETFRCIKFKGRYIGSFTP